MNPGIRHFVFCTLFRYVLFLLSLSCSVPRYYPTSYTGGADLYSIYDRLDNVAVLVSADGQFLGLVSSNKFDSKSITNRYGSYGSSYSSTSIFNEYGEYGSKYSSKSPFNKYASEPPMIYMGSNFVAYLTINAYKIPRIDPFSLIGYLRSK